MLDNILRKITFFQIGIVLFGLYVVYWIASRRAESKRIKKLGGRTAIRHLKLPMGLDFMYELLQASGRGEVLEFWLKTFEKYANANNPWTVEVGWGADRVILTADPENIKAILATQFQDYGKGEIFNKDWHDFLGDSIFTTDGEKWHNSRQLLRPQFIKDRVSDLNIFEKHTSVLLPMLDRNGNAVNVSDLFFRYALDAATDFLLGRSVDSLTYEKDMFAEAFNKVQQFQSLIARVGPLNWMLFRRKFYQNLKTMNDFVYTFVDDALRLSPEELQKTAKLDDGYTFLHALANYTRDKQTLRDQLVAVLLAGRDTTACTLSWTFYELSKRPKIVQRLRQELLETIGPDRPPTYADLKNMRYLQHVMNETLRLYPVVPFNMRMALKDTTLPSGGGEDGKQPIGVLKDNPIGYSTLAMQRRSDLYPPVSSGFPPVEDFVPERWDNWIPKSWNYVPFNGGPRICIGQQFALTEMGYTIVKILQRYDQLEYRGDGFPGMKTDIVLAPLKPVDIIFYRTNDKA